MTVRSISPTVNSRGLATPRSVYFEAAAPRPQAPPLQGRQRARIGVLGAGLTGCSAALHLAETIDDVVLIEAGVVGAGASGRNGGQLCSGLPSGVLALERHCGEATSRQLWALAEQAKQRVHDLARRYRIDYRFRPGNLAAAETHGQLRHLLDEAGHLRDHYDYPGIEPVDRAALGTLVDTPLYVGGVLDRHGGHLDPLALTRGLADAAVARGARLYEGSPALRVELDGRPRVRTASGELECDRLLVCTGAYLQGAVLPVMSGGLLPIVSFVGATAPLPESVAKALMPFAGSVYSTARPIDYYRLDAQGRLLFGSGSALFDLCAEQRRWRLRRRMLRVFPRLRGLSEAGFAHVWSGRVGVTRNRLLDFGRLGDRVWYARGYSGHGVALAVEAGWMLADKVAGHGASFDLVASLPTRPFPGRVLGRAWASWVHLLRGQMASR
ncbi:MAG: FAD-binding oxidoreductase [Gammaproteobacteria bacterium]|nr:FAD-binding oxidoreductase [Gammaproteobacteria bacterium]